MTLATVSDPQRSVVPRTRAPADSAVHDVALIGLGPTGAVAAALLGNLGVAGRPLRILALDRARTIHDKPRAVALDHEIMRILQECGIAKALAPQLTPFTLSENYGADGQLLRRVGMLPKPWPLGWPPTATFRQPDAEQLLRDRLAALPDVTVMLGQSLTALSQDPDGVDLRLEDASGSTVGARARYVIGADGASSTVRRLLGVEVEDFGFNAPWLVIDLLANERGIERLPKVSTHFYDPKRPGMYVVCGGNHRRFEFMVLPGEDPEQLEQEGSVWALLARWISPQDAQLWRRASYRFRSLVAREWRRGRVFLAGDAAHQQPPFLGQGMCQGIRDASNLAWKLHQVMAAQASDPLLDTYFEERNAHVRSLLDTILGIGRYMCVLDPVAARARDAALLARNGGEVKTLIRQDLMPGLVAGWLAPEPHPACGTLFPQPRVQRARGATGTPDEDLLDDAAGTGWRVVLAVTASDWQVVLPTPLGEFMQVVPMASAPTQPGWIETDGIVAAWFERHQCKATLIRPDHYVHAACGSSTELHSVLHGLAKRLAGEIPQAG